MANTTLKVDNTGKPAPRWFRKLKEATGYLIDGAIVILLALGHGDNSLLMLLLRIGYARVMSALEALLANGEVYAPAEALKQNVIIVVVDQLPATGDAGIWYQLGNFYYYWGGASFVNAGGDRPTKPPVNP